MCTCNLPLFFPGITSFASSPISPSSPTVVFLPPFFPISPWKFFPFRGGVLRPQGVLTRGSSHFNLFETLFLPFPLSVVGFTFPQPRVQVSRVPPGSDFKGLGLPFILHSPSFEEPFPILLFALGSRRTHKVFFGSNPIPFPIFQGPQRRTLGGIPLELSFLHTRFTHLRIQRLE